MAEVKTNLKRFQDKFTAVIIGECGMGKSTFAYNLAGRPQLEGGRCLDGMTAGGVTKNFEAFDANLRGIGLCDAVLDSPGLGDQDVKLAEWVAKAEKSFSEVNAILVCVSETNPRITMGAELVTMMINRGFLGHIKGSKEEVGKLLKNSIVLVGTKGNLATKKMRKAMPKIAASFAEKCGLKAVTYIGVDAGDWEEPDDYDETPVLDISRLQQHLQSLQKLSSSYEKGKVMQYKIIEANDMVNMVCSVMGLQLTEENRLQMVKDLGFWRNLLAGLKNLFCFDKYSSARAIHHFQKVANATGRVVSSIWDAIVDVFVEDIAGGMFDHDEFCDF